MITVGQLLSFHRLDRSTYLKLIHLGHPTGTARKITALWMFLQCLGIDILNYLSDCTNDTVVSRFASEAATIVAHCSENRSVSEARIPYTRQLTMSSDRLDFVFFDFNKRVIARGMDYVLDGIGGVLLEEEVGDLGRPYYGGPALDDEDRRTVFVRISDGNALGMGHVLREFQGKCGGHCVEKMVATREGEEPKYGRIVLRDEGVMDQIFVQREQVVEMEIYGCKVWARMINPLFE